MSFIFHERGIEMKLIIDRMSLLEVLLDISVNIQKEVTPLIFEYYMLENYGKKKDSA